MVSFFLRLFCVAIGNDFFFLSFSIALLGKKEGYAEETIVPIFISCDPKRDSVAAIKEYVRGKKGS